MKKNSLLLPTFAEYTHVILYQSLVHMSRLFFLSTVQLTFSQITTRRVLKREYYVFFSNNCIVFDISDMERS